MNCSTSRWTGLPAVVIVAGVGSTAWADPGDHVRAGDAVVTPSVMTGVEHHTNAYLLEGVGDSDIIPATAWVLTPRIAVELPGDSLELQLGAGWGIKKFIDFEPDNATNLEKLDRYTDFDATLGLDALTRSLVGFHLEDRFEVQNSPTELQTSTEEGSANAVHTSNDLNAGAAIRPGSALEVAALGNVGLDIYTIPGELVEEGGDPNLNNRTSYGPLVNARWNFLPKTALLGSASVSWLRWDNNLIPAVGPEAEGVEYGEYIGKPDASMWRAQFGLRGQFTDKIAASVELGYGQMYYDESTVTSDPQAAALDPTSGEITVTGAETFARDLTSFGEGFVVNAQLAWSPRSGHTLTTGYRKDFSDAFFTNYVAYNNVFLRYEGLYASRVGLTGEFAYRIDQFHGEVSRGDQNIRLKLNSSYRFTDYLSAGLGGGWVERACVDVCGTEGEFFSTQYDDFWFTAGATFTY